jgi:glycosyltransferase involved in cell wall biosynthesis
MNWLVVIDSVSRSAGGLFDAERLLHQNLSDQVGVVPEVFALEDEFSLADAAAWYPIRPRTFPVRGPRSIGFSPTYRKMLSASSADLIYRAGLWSLLSQAAASWSKICRKPEIIAPHGMLDSWAVKNSAWKKKLALFFYEREHLQNAACLRALCESEAKAMRAFGLKNPICIIPNGIDLPSLVESSELKVEREGQEAKQGAAQRSMLRTPRAEETSNIQHRTSLRAVGCYEPEANIEWKPDRKVLLYLGRIHPKKGLVNLLRAWAEIRKSESGKRKAEEWVLAIAGWDQGGHEDELKRLASELGIQWSDAREHRTSNSDKSRAGIEHPTPINREQASNIQRTEDGCQKSNFSISEFQLSAFSLLFLGPQFGDDKAACYRNCDAFILPSFSEGLPMVVLEAWAHGKPVLMTPECNLPEGFTANAAIRIEPSVESIVQGLDMLFQSSISDLQSIGSRGRALVAEKFTWPKIAMEMKSVYEWVLGGGAKPNCVI